MGVLLPHLEVADGAAIASGGGNTAGDSTAAEQSLLALAVSPEARVVYITSLVLTMFSGLQAQPLRAKGLGSQVPLRWYPASASAV